MEIARTQATINRVVCNSITQYSAIINNLSIGRAITTYLFSTLFLRLLSVILLLLGYLLRHDLLHLNIVFVLHLVVVFLLAALATLRHQVVLLFHVNGGLLVVAVVLLLLFLVFLVLLDIRPLFKVVFILNYNFGALLRGLTTALTLFGAQTYKSGK